MRHFTQAPKTLTDHEIHKLLNESGRNEADFRDHMIFSMALGSGLRVRELVSLDVQSVLNGRGARGIITLRPQHTKGGKGGCVALPERLRRKLSAFIKWKTARMEPINPESPLFCSRGGYGSPKGSRLSVRSAQSIFKVWQKRLGFDRSCNFHMLRHTFCTNLWKSSGDLRLVQLAARHSNPSTTAIYTHPSQQDLIEGVQGVVC